MIRAWEKGKTLSPRQESNPGCPEHREAGPVYPLSYENSLRETEQHSVWDRITLFIRNYANYR